MDKNYQLNLKKMTKLKGFSAVLLFVLLILSGYIQGLFITANFPVNILEIINSVWPCIDLLLGIALLLVFRDSFSTIGLSRYNFKKGILIGTAVSVFLLVVYFCSFKLINGADKIQIVYQGIGLSFITFITGAISEEITFRGYIETRLHGIIGNTYVVAVITGILFVVMHYSFFWGTSGTFGFGFIKPLHIFLLFVLHLCCSYVYRKTNSLWGSMFLHFIYNFVTSIVVLG